VIRHTTATLAQKKGTVKDVQGLLRHLQAATTTDVYTHEIPESVQAAINCDSCRAQKEARINASRLNFLRICYQMLPIGERRFL